MEDDLAKHGVHIVAGAEVEFFAQDESGQPWLEKISPKQLQYQLSPTFTLLEKVYEESEGKIGQYELVLGTHRKIPDIINPQTPYYASVELATQLVKLKDTLVEHMKKLGIPKISFEPQADYSKAVPGRLAVLATNSVHINCSAVDNKGTNLFKNDHNRNHSSLARQSAAMLLQLQQDGFALYAPSSQSFKRFGRNQFAPAVFKIGENSLSDSISLRGKYIGATRKIYRMEDRLAGGDVESLLPLLAGVGAIWHTVCRNPSAGTQKLNEKHADIPSPVVPQEEVEALHARAITALANSALWREIAGEELFHDIVASQKSHAQPFAR